MTKEEIFIIWAPEKSVWSAWVKPVLFAQMQPSAEVSPPMIPSIAASWVPAADQNYAIVLDLPGDQGVWIGLALANLGYQPVPLYNALPMPIATMVLDPLSTRPLEVVNVRPIMIALRQCANNLATINLPADSRPVFLLDANRHGPSTPPLPDQFDNRSVCFTTDFPSANFLAANKVEKILLVQLDSLEPQQDLAHVLRRWQDGGLSLERIRIDTSSPRESFQVSRPAWYRSMFQRALVSLGLRHAPGGGFGRWMPDSSAGG